MAVCGARFYRVLFYLSIGMLFSALVNYSLLDNSTPMPFRTGPEPQLTKTILCWNGHDRMETKALLANHNCAFKNCLITTNRSLLNSFGDFDAIIFNVGALVLSYDQLRIDHHLPPSNLLRRRAHQRYVFFTLESPFYLQQWVRDYNGYFNWTMTYLSRADIPYEYGQIRPLLTTNDDDNPMASSRKLNAKLKAKTKLVAWFVSHCNTHSKREVYANELQKYIPVDIYGRCGPLKCDKDDGEDVSPFRCYDVLDKDYKFYLSFENSLCRGYVTEKFYTVLRNYNVVPVVMGRVNYAAIAPPHSFIDALHYTPKELADYLLKLDANETLYGAYFTWRSRYSVIGGYEEMGRQAFCSLCAKINTDNRTKIIDLESEWSASISCLSARYLKPFLGIGQ